ncbi:hypothetical protein F4778DRAFT_748381 [Xylariomycetidae sp. FL2044]|nr:hypothetical protein F4778DRAFT_748381 [Xylariomycetidae sp. FL2044]
MVASHSDLSSLTSEDFDDEYTSQPSPHHEDALSNAPETELELSTPGRLNHREYSDREFEMLYRIALRSEEILAGTSPSSRLPTHALFKAYYEILPTYGYEPDDDQKFSKIMFIIGGIRGNTSMVDKFKAFMKEMDVGLAFDTPQNTVSDAGDNYVSPVSSSDHPIPPIESRMYHPHRVTLSTKPERYRLDKAPNHNEAFHDHHVARHSSNGAINGLNGFNPASDDDQTSNASSRQDTRLAEVARAFHEIHHVKFHSVNAVRQWHTRSHYINDLCTQITAARQADIEDDVEEKFMEWRAVSNAVANAPIHDLPHNIYSRRIERIAVRTHEIQSTKNALGRWRQAARQQCQREPAEEKFPGADENHPLAPLARLAERAHKNLILSRAFTNWSNRAEEETEKAQMAARAYEMSLKAKAFGIRRFASAAAAAAQPAHAPPQPAHTLTQASCTTVEPTRVNTEPLQAAVRTATMPVHSNLPAPATTEFVQAIVKPPFATTANPADDSDSSEEMDEQTMLARRHILRMRYFNAWESHVTRNLERAREFQEEQQEKRLVMDTIPTWREKAAQQERHGLDMRAERANFYSRTTRALPIWRDKAEDVHSERQVLAHYSESANFYYKTTQALPVWRENAKVAAQNQAKILEHYAQRADFYYRVTEAMPVWRLQAQEAAEQDERLRTQADYLEYETSTRNTLVAWKQLAKQKRKDRLREAYLETRRIVKKGMGARCVVQWREKLGPSFIRYEVMNSTLEELISNREWQQVTQAFEVWRTRAQEKNDMAFTSDAVAKQKTLQQWQQEAIRRQETQAEAHDYRESRAAARALKNWNREALQHANRPAIVASALEKKDRRVLRQGFEGWYSKTADKLVPVQLPDGSYRNIDQVVEDAQYQATQNRARGLLRSWKEAANRKTEITEQPSFAPTPRRADALEEASYAPTPGRPQLFRGALGRRQTTTPLAPVPSRSQWQPGSSLMAGRASRTGRSKGNLRVSWAA